MEKRLIQFALVCLLAMPMMAQAQGGAEFFVGGQYSRPFSLTRETHFGVDNETGLFGNPGGGLTLEANSRNMFGIGGVFSFSIFGMNHGAFADHLGAQSMQWSGTINSTQLGLGPVFNLPLIEERVFFQAKSYLGFRFIGIPDFELSYDPRDSRFTTVEYSTPAHASTFYQLDGGFQFFPSENIGITLGLGYVGGTVNTINYDFRTDGSKIIQGSDQINQSIHYLNYRFGLVFKN